MDKAIQEWVQHTIVSHLKNKGVVPSNSGPVQCIIKLQSNEGLCSLLYSVVIEFGQSQLKLMTKVLASRKDQYFNDMFINEAAMYETILPILTAGHPEVHSFLTKCYCANLEPDRAMVVMEDVSHQGFRHTSRTVDFEHMLLSLKALGKFHALSYAAKKTNASFFQREIVDRIPGVFNDAVSKAIIVTVYSESYSHVLNVFRKRFPEYAVRHSHILERIKQVIENNLMELMASATGGGPLAVVCHGDFTRNNLMFRYDEEGRVQDMKMLDFQLSRYCSPMLDISSIISINTSPELRADHLDDLISAYHGSVVESLAGFLGCPPQTLEEEFSLEAFQKEYRRGAVHGFFLAAYFLEAALEGSEYFPGLADVSTEVIEANFAFLRERRRQYSEEVNRRLAALLKELLDNNYLEHHILKTQ